MWIVHIIFASVFIILGIVFMNGKGAFLIAGYNTSRKDVKDNIDKKALCRFMGKSMFALSACWLIMALSDALDSMIPLWLGIGLVLFIVFFMVVYANTGNRFKK